MLLAEYIDGSTDLSTAHVQHATPVDSTTIFDAQEQGIAAIHAAGGETPWSIAWTSATAGPGMNRLRASAQVEK